MVGEEIGPFVLPPTSFAGMLRLLGALPSDAML